VDTSLNITDAFKTGARVYRQHWGPLLLIALLIFAVPFVLLFLAAEDILEPLWLFVVIWAVLYKTGLFWFKAYATHLLATIRRDEEVRHRTLTRETFRGFPRVSTVGALVFFGTVIGLFLLIVPGLIFAARRAVAIPVAVMEGKGAFYGKNFRDPAHSAMHRSKELVMGNSFEVFAVLAAINVVYGAFDQFLPLLHVLIAPWGALSVASMYFDLVDQKAGRGRPATGPVSPAAPVEQSPDAAWRPSPAPAQPPAPPPPPG
jgi:hypothetical protein